MSSLEYYILFILGLILLMGVGLQSNVFEQRTRPLAWLWLSLFAGLRAGVGADYLAYEHAYYHPTQATAQAFEPLWQSLNALMLDGRIPFQFWILLTSSITYALLFYGFKRLKINWVYGILVFLLLQRGFGDSIQIIRHYLALSVVFVGLKDLINKRYLRFAGFLFIASLIHNSAPILFLLYPIMLYRWDWRWHLGFLITSFCLGRFAFGSLLSVALPYFPERYIEYVQNGASVTTITTGTLQYFLIALALGAIYYRHHLKEQESDERLRIALSVFPFAVYIYNVFSTFDPGLRLMAYPFQWVFVALPILIYRAKTLRQLSIPLGITLIFGMFTVKDFINRQLTLSHYQTIFDNKPPLDRTPRILSPNDEEFPNPNQLEFVLEPNQPNTSKE